MIAGSIQTCAQPGYLRKGTLYIQGHVSDQGIFKNNRQLKFIEKVEPVTYAPDQIEEYGFINGAVYIKRAVPEGQGTTDYFLLRLISGKRTLYQLREKKGSRFFIANDSALTEIKEEAPLEGQLDALLNPCGAHHQIAALAQYSTTSLRRATLLSNQCYAGLFPKLRKGILAGYDFSSQSIGTVMDHIFTQASGSFPVYGIFADVPLGMSSSWFINIQATYQQCNFNDVQVDNNTALEYQYNFSTIGLPMLLKFRGSSSTWRPFIALGPTPAFYTQQQNEWLKTTYVGSVAYLNQGAWDSVKKFQICGTLCAGFEYSLNQQKAFSVELRYKKLIDAQVGPSQSLALIGSFYF